MPVEKPLDEKEMLQQITEGNKQAFRRLFNTYRSKLYTYLLKITGSKKQQKMQCMMCS
jgi:DNA-directed RNA polymerase specialized sigma24 family protein